MKKGITKKMREVLISRYGLDGSQYQTNHKARMLMINTLLGEGMHGEFTCYEDTRKDALKKVKVFEETYDIEVKENEEEGYFHFDTWCNGSIYHGMSAKIHYILDEQSEES